MIIDDPTIYYAVLAGKAFVLLLGTIVLLSMWRQTRRVEQYLAELRNAPAPEEQKTDASKQHLIASLRLDKRISELQQQIAALSVAEKKAEHGPASRPLPIENATRMARHGASVEELTRTCGLNVGEAELLKKLHSAPTTIQSHRVQ